MKSEDFKINPSVFENFLENTLCKEEKRLGLRIFGRERAKRGRNRVRIQNRLKEQREIMAIYCILNEKRTANKYKSRKMEKSR